MQRNGTTTATKDAVPTPTPADNAGGTLPAELRFLAAQATDPQERERIVRAYYTFAHGTPDSCDGAVCFAGGGVVTRQLCQRPRT